MPQPFDIAETPEDEDLLGYDAVEVDAAASAETLIWSGRVRSGHRSHITAFGNAADNGAERYIEFRVYVNNSRLPGPLFSVVKAMGSLDKPTYFRPANWNEIPSGALVEVRAYNSHASTTFAVSAVAIVTHYKGRL